MQQLTSNLFVETGIRGCNHGFVTTSDGIVMIDSPHKPSDALKLKAEIARRGGRLRYIINTEPHGDHWTGNAFFDVPVIAHEGVRTRILETNLEEHVARVATFGPEEPKLLEGYRPNAPVITFTNGMTLHVGNHTFELIHMPGHTAYQAAICIKEEGAVFTSDNIFHKCHTWLQEANPDEWLTALDSLRGLKEEVFVPGHGPVCGKSYLDEQGSFIKEWKTYVQKAVDRGMSKAEAVEKLTDLTDRYPMDIGQDGMAPSVMKRNVSNLYEYLTKTGTWAPAR
ncbi:MAG TPA: MBL fold metallo-hydrolase [Burkholderiales bacterium]|jgi:glyoxylase-like metal-dependent hydrolase (beta-lactamase superfamily II)|nr:MBL fold metallo-hydrolase [Burkholderiales bacterium]